MHVARVRWIGKEQFAGQAPSGHLVPVDADRSSNAAPGPMELLLIALGACTGTDVVAILVKKRQPLEALELEISGEQAEEPPRVWNRIEVVYKLRGNLDRGAVEHAIQLSEEKYCPVAATLRKTAAMTYRIEINPS